MNFKLIDTIHCVVTMVILHLAHSYTVTMSQSKFNHLSIDNQLNLAIKKLDFWVNKREQEPENTQYKQNYDKLIIKCHALIEQLDVERAKLKREALREAEANAFVAMAMSLTSEPAMTLESAQP